MPIREGNLPLQQKKMIISITAAITWPTGRVELAPADRGAGPSVSLTAAIIRIRLDTKIHRIKEPVPQDIVRDDTLV